MYCAKCGKQLAEGAKFCDVCGEGILRRQEEARKSNKGPAKVPKGLIITLSAVVAVVLIGIVLYNNIWRILPVKTYYAYLELKNRPITFNKTFKDITSGLEIKPFSKDIELNVTSMDGLESMQSTLRDFTIQAQVDYSKDKIASYTYLKYMNNVLLDALIYSDNEIVGFGLPLMYDSMFFVNQEEIMTAISNITGNVMVEQNKDKIKSGKELLVELDSDTKLLDKTFNKYSKLILDNIPSDNVEVTNPGDSISIYTWNNGRSRPAKEIENYKQVEIKLSQGDLYKIADKLLAELMKDDVLLERIYYYTQNSYVSLAGGLGDTTTDKATAIDEMKESIGYTRDNLYNSVDAESKNIMVTMTIIADNRDNIISREVSTDEGIVTFTHYINDNKEEITELNVSEGRLGTGGQTANLYVYLGESSKGIYASSSESDRVELSYVRSDKGKNNSGLEYGDYKARLKTTNDDYVVTMSADKDESSKGADILKVRVQNYSKDLFSLNISMNDLKNKSKLKFNKSGAVNLARTDSYNVQEILSELEKSFYSISDEFSNLLN